MGDKKLVGRKKPRAREQEKDRQQERRQQQQPPPPPPLPARERGGRGEAKTLDGGLYYSLGLGVGRLLGGLPLARGFRAFAASFFVSSILFVGWAGLWCGWCWPP